MKQNSVAIGADIENISRFYGLNRRKNRIFLNKIYTVKELAYCFNKSNPGPHLAGRFAAKEAVFKALSAMGISGAPLKKIEISATIDSVPRVILRGFKKYKLEVSVSISHCADWAIAFALVNNYEKSKRKNFAKRTV